MSRLGKLFLLLVCLASLAVEPSIVNAQRGRGGDQPASAGPFGALRWRSLGPARGGRSLAVSGSIARPNEYYMGATGGGLWKTTDGGTTWREVTDGQLHTCAVVGEAGSTAKPANSYRGTAEVDDHGH